MTHLPNWSLGVAAVGLLVAGGVAFADGILMMDWMTAYAVYAHANFTTANVTYSYPILGSVSASAWSSFYNGQRDLVVGVVLMLAGAVSLGVWLSKALTSERGEC